jgi:hypothetical protein
MTAAGALALRDPIGSDAVALPSQAIETLDYLATVFLELQHRAAKLYGEAYRADFPHEQLKERLIEMVRDVGRQAADGARVLTGNEYEIRLTLGASNYFDPDAVTSFRYALIRHGFAKGILSDIFTGSMQYQFKDSANKILDRLRLPASLRQMYEGCRSRTEILSVSPICAAPAGD